MDVHMFIYNVVKPRNMLSKTEVIISVYHQLPDFIQVETSKSRFFVNIAELNKVFKTLAKGRTKLGGVVLPKDSLYVDTKQTLTTSATKDGVVSSIYENLNENVMVVSNPDDSSVKITTKDFCLYFSIYNLSKIRDTLLLYTNNK